MKVIKFSINEKYYTALKVLCDQKGIVIKKMINVLLSQDIESVDIKAYFPSDFNENTKSITLKINEELYKGIMKKCGKLDIKPSKYVPYLIYKRVTEDQKLQ